MKTNKYLLSFVVPVVVLLISGFILLQLNEDPTLSAIKNLVANYNRNVPYEKIYLHIDRPFYKPGEDIWFKVYLTNANNTPSTKSDIVYVELISPKGTVEKTLTLQTIQGICFGDFVLGESAAGGIYKIKAYTQWMRNFGDDYIFEKDIQVQKVVYSRLLSKLNFKRESYGPGDMVKAELSLESLENVPLAFRNVNMDISLNGEKYRTFEAVTNNNGKVLLSFRLPSDLSSNDGLINVKIPHEGNTEAISRAIPIILNKISLQFFPEGGYMVEKIPGRIAFKALNEFGKPADIEGYITDEAGNTVANMISYHDGMGAFDMAPSPGKQYFATITKPAIEEKFPLPEAMSNGYVMKIEKSSKEKYTAQIYSPLEGPMHLVVQSGKTVCFSQTIQAIAGLNKIEFSSGKFPVGVGMVTLFDQAGVPRCERLVFFNYHKQLHISLQFDKKKYLPREKVNLKIITTDQDSIPVPANLSLSVVNNQLYTFADDKQHNILTWLLIGSDVKGKIEKPEFYFNKEEPKAEQALDYLLLTQGWRRYKWNDVLNQNYAITFQAQKLGCISGKVINKHTGEPVKAEVTIVELDNRQRILKVNTGTDGKFKFLDADVNATIQLLASSNKVSASALTILSDKLNNPSGLNTATENIKDTEFLPGVIKEKAQEKKNERTKVKIADNGNNKGEKVIPAGNEMMLQEDTKNLEEVVVVGYGTQKNQNLACAATVVTVRKEAPLLNQNGELSQALQGRVAGVDVVNNTGGPGVNTKIMIRGASSFTNNHQPLFVVDGVVYDQNLSGNPNPLENIPVSDINSVTVLKDAVATAVYGCRGANGVIQITTSSGYGSLKRVKRPFSPKYTGITIQPQKTSYIREFYYPVYDNEEIPEVRKDFRSTVYWNPNINTNMAGEATIEFYTSDEITSFRAITEGIGSNGCVGRKEEKYYAQLPFSMAVKFPSYLSFNDTVIMPLIVKNNTDKPIKGQLSFTLPQSIHPVHAFPGEIEIKANSSFTLSVPFSVVNIAGKDTMTVAFKGDKFKDAFIQEVDVQPKGFPTKVSISGKDKEKHYTFSISKPMNGSVKAEFTAFPDLLSDLLSGVESILREPYGCFEQTSSSTYPNIMVMQYLNETGSTNKEVSKRATELIKKGYDRLISFETSQKGYEWFGQSPAHEGLTAYGLMEFTDMNEVYGKVDKTMIDRTLKWILAQRDGKGNFIRNTRALDQFGRASNEVTRAYIVYALSEAEIDQVETEYQLAFEEAIKSQDPYRMALMANAAYNFKKKKDGDRLLELLSNKIANKNPDYIKIDHSITYSTGKSLAIETAALHTLAILKSAQPNINEINNNVNYMVSSRSYGGFGSTQGTILALKALKEYAKFSKQTSDDGAIEIVINEQHTVTHQYHKGDRGKILLNGLEKFLKEGENTLSIRYLETKEPLSYTFDAGWTSLTPKTDADCNVDISTNLSTNFSKVGETVRLNVRLQNKTSKGQPMTMAVVGIPSGLSVQPWQLKEMQEKHKFDFYEVRKNYLVLYYRQMAPNELRELNFDLKAEIPGTYQAPASSGYLYYTNEFKDWEDGEFIKIEPM